MRKDIRTDLFLKHKPFMMKNAIPSHQTKIDDSLSAKPMAPIDGPKDMHEGGLLAQQYASASKEAKANASEDAQVKLSEPDRERFSSFLSLNKESRPIHLHAFYKQVMDKVTTDLHDLKDASDTEVSANVVVDRVGRAIFESFPTQWMQYAYDLMLLEVVPQTATDFFETKVELQAFFERRTRTGRAIVDYETFQQFV